MGQPDFGALQRGSDGSDGRGEFAMSPWLGTERDPRTFTKGRGPRHVNVPKVGHDP